MTRNYYYYRPQIKFISFTIGAFALMFMFRRNFCVMLTFPFFLKLLKIFIAVFLYYFTNFLQKTRPLIFLKVLFINIYIIHDKSNVLFYKQAFLLLKIRRYWRLIIFIGFIIMQKYIL